MTMTRLTKKLRPNPSINQETSSKRENIFKSHSKFNKLEEQDHLTEFKIINDKTTIITPYYKDIFTNFGLQLRLGNLEDLETYLNVKTKLNDGSYPNFPFLGITFHKNSLGRGKILLMEQNDVLIGLLFYFNTPEKNSMATTRLALDDEENQELKLYYSQTVNIRELLFNSTDSLMQKMFLLEIQEQFKGRVIAFNSSEVERRYLKIGRETLFPLKKIMTYCFLPNPSFIKNTLAEFQELTSQASSAQLASNISLRYTPTTLVAFQSNEVNKEINKVHFDTQFNYLHKFGLRIIKPTQEHLTGLLACFVPSDLSSNESVPVDYTRSLLGNSTDTSKIRYHLMLQHIASNTTVGAIYYNFSNQDLTCYIDSIQIREGFENKHYATNLFLACVHHLNKLNCERIMLYSSEEGLPFYIALGFEPKFAANKDDFEEEDFIRLKENFKQIKKEWASKNFSEKLDIAENENLFDFSLNLKNPSIIAALNERLEKLQTQTIPYSQDIFRKPEIKLEKDDGSVEKHVLPNCPPITTKKF